MSHDASNASPFDRTPPHDPAAERAVLAAVMETPDALRTAMEIVGPDDFYRPDHADLFRVCLKLYTDGERVDAIAVNAALMSAGQTRAMEALREVVGYVGVTDVGYAARLVHDRSRLRQLIGFGHALHQRAFQPGDQTADQIIDWAADHTRILRDSGVLTDEDLTAITLDELFAIEITYDWVIPGLLERGDRFLLTGVEGLGKSYLNRQLAVCAAAGLHPFTHAPIEPCKVLVIDAENSVKGNRRAYEPLVSACRAHNADPLPRLLLDQYPYGTNVLDTRQGNKLLRLVELQRPDIVVIGPAYKLHEVDDEKAGEALRIQKYLDRLRAVCGSALIMEMHAPHGQSHGRERDLRPAGSSVWRRWPEFGYGMAPSHDFSDEERERFRPVDLRTWRGPRDVRAWPRNLRKGNRWPWVLPNDDDAWSPSSHATDSADRPHDPTEPTRHVDQDAS